MNLQTMFHQFLDYKLLFKPKTTKSLVSPYPIIYNKPSVTPTSQKMGAHFVTVTGQRVTNKNVIQRIPIPNAIIKYLHIKTLNKFIKLN